MPESLNLIEREEGRKAEMVSFERLKGAEERGRTHD
jgi:hypothetical protein